MLLLFLVVTASHSPDPYLYIIHQNAVEVIEIRPDSFTKVAPANGADSGRWPEKEWRVGRDPAGYSIKGADTLILLYAGKN